MKKINVCLSPALFDLYAEDDTVIVLIDAIRASASICTAFMNDVELIVPVTEIDDVEYYRRKGYITAGERDGEKIKGFDLGNSPEGFTEDAVKGKKMVMTTTNGTQIIRLFKAKKFKHADLIVGSFLNVSVLTNFLIAQKKDILLLCSGWKNTVNIEDTLLAGRIIDLLMKKENHQVLESGSLAYQFYLSMKDPYYDFILRNSPRLCSKSKELERDFRYCLIEDSANVVPFLENDYLKV
jgi:2-phosphosulfolactate phosphatase